MIFDLCYWSVTLGFEVLQAKWWPQVHLCSLAIDISLQWDCPTVIKATLWTVKSQLLMLICDQVKP